MGNSGRGSPARKSAYPAYLKAPDIPEHAQYFLDAMDKYAETGHPYHTTAAAEVEDIFNRNTHAGRHGREDRRPGVANIMKDAQPLLDKAPELNLIELHSLPGGWKPSGRTSARFHCRRGCI